jgi:hypothetical protein
MLQQLSLRKALRTVMFLLTCLLMTGCYTLKTVTVNSIPADKQVMIIHADENFWTAWNYSFSDGNLTAQLGTDTVKVRKAKTVHIYVAPVSAVSVEGTTLTVPVVNIGKTDYQAINLWETLGLCVGGGWLLYSMIIPAFF